MGNDAEGTYADSRNLLIGIIIVVILMGIGIGIFIARSITRPVADCINAAHKIASGDMDVVLDASGKDETGLLQASMMKMAESIRALMTDAFMLSKAAVEGKLDTRADAGRHQGDFRKIVQGVNETLDAVIGPLNMAAECVERIAKGDIPPKITENYNGDFSEIKNNINFLIEAMNNITGLAQEIAGGNLMVQVRERSQQDELMRAHGFMAKKLIEVVREVKTAAENVASGSQELSANSEHMSQGATEQAASAEEASHPWKRCPPMSSRLLKTQKTADLVQEITAASRKQDMGAEQINKAIQQLDQVIRQNASAAEEMASTSEELSLQAEQLQNIIAFFKVEENRDYRVKAAGLPKAPGKPPKEQATLAAHGRANGYAVGKPHAVNETKGIEGLDFGMIEDNDNFDSEFERF